MNKGQSLVEMIVIIGMVVLLATGIVAGTVASLSRSETSKARSEALSFAQAGIELTRGVRDAGWNTFVVKGSPPSTYCVGSDAVFGQPQASCTAFNIEDTYVRSVTLDFTTVSGTPTMKVTSKVAWGDIANPVNAVTLTTYLTQWR